MDWKKIEGMEFTEQEAREASDFSDIIDSFGFPQQELKDFIDSKDLKTGHRLYIAVNLNVDDALLLLLNEKDERILKILKKRVQNGEQKDKS